MDTDNLKLIELIRKTFKSELIVIYDGSCPVCNNLTLHANLLDNFDSLDLVNARDIPDQVLEMREEFDVDLNQGIIVINNDDFYFAGEALSFIALHSSEKKLYGRVINKFFGIRFISVNLYPFWKTARSLLLLLLGRKKL